MILSQMGPGRAIALGLLLSTLSFAAPAPTPSPGASASPRPTITEAQARVLAREFKKAQRTQLQALGHRSRVEMRELKAAQKAQLKEWLRNEGDKRHEYFAQPRTGPEKRAYIQDFIRRRDALLEMQKQERKRREQEHKAHEDAVERNQGEKWNEFSADLQHHVRPPDDLWPRAGE